LTFVNDRGVAIVVGQGRCLRAEIGDPFPRLKPDLRTALAGRWSIASANVSFCIAHGAGSRLPSVN